MSPEQLQPAKGEGQATLSVLFLPDWPEKNELPSGVLGILKSRESSFFIAYHQPLLPRQREKTDARSFFSLCLVLNKNKQITSVLVAAALK